MRLPTLLIAALAALTGCASDAPTDSGPLLLLQQHAFPEVLRLPAGFWPEGIALGRGTTVYVGSLATGALFRGNVRTGTGALLVAPREGRELVGMKYDARCDRLIVAGGFGGQAYLFDATTGAELATYQLANPEEGPSLLNDVVLTPQGAYFTDSFRPVLYRLPLAAGCRTPPASAAETIALGGDFLFDPEAEIGNANGIAATPSGDWLIVVNTATGRLYRVDRATGHASLIVLDDPGAAEGGDGILLIDHTLYVVQGHLNRIAVLALSGNYGAATLQRTLTSDQLRFPSTVAALGNYLYAVNARFDVPPGPDVEYEVVRVQR